MSHNCVIDILITNAYFLDNYIVKRSDLLIYAQLSRIVKNDMCISKILVSFFSRHSLKSEYFAS